MSVNLVTTDSVRAVLGVSSKELPDTVLSNPIYATLLKEDLIAMNSQILMDFVTIGNVASPTSSQQRFLDLIETYAAYNVAMQCVTSLPMFAPMTIQDEKAALIRTQDFYVNLKTDVAAAMSVIKGRLLAVYALINPAAPAPNTVARVYGVAVGLGVDPVTGV